MMPNNTLTLADMMNPATGLALCAIVCFIGAIFGIPAPIAG
ncbi:MAG: hypothetical protein U9Q15_03355 [Patescibacteria group bacterium]|nr:hypothetical protein [Patescibacteria group bacterium]